ncbi:MAG: gliding motility-associated protein GldE [Saprospiraceae bacterium]|nr:gliding motility-associated protein GldE [Saprospiraceae bacterium]
METDPSHIYDFFQLAPLLLIDFNTGILSNALVIIALLCCSGLLSGSEVAYFSLGNKEKSQLKEDSQSDVAERILLLLSTPRYLLSTILISNNIVNIALILVSGSLINQLLPEHWGFISQQWDFIIDGLITVGLVTFILVLFGEVAPKVYANQNSLQIAKVMSRPFIFLQKLFYPLSWLLVNSTQFVENRLARINQSTVSQEDIASAIELTVKGNKYEKQDVDMLKSILRFGNTSAAEIMKPRMKVIALDLNATFGDLVHVFREESYSRIPIYGEDLDDIKGIIHAKDLLGHIGSKEDFNWHDLIRPALITTEKRKIDDLFQDFQEKRTHMAIVVDEYGGTEGIVTLEDILEEIVGEIQDEFDIPEEDNFDKIDDFTFDFDGETPLIEVCKVLNIQPDFFDDVRKGAETIAGLVLVINGTIPNINTSVVCKQYQLITIKASERKIEKIRVVLQKKNNINLPSSVSDNK